MKVVLVSQVPPAVHGLTELLRALGHKPVALLCSREHAGRYGNEFERLVRHAPQDLDVVIPATRGGIAPLLRRYEPDLLLCLGFPWKIPPDALAVPRLGCVNGHPSLLPRYRGPNPVAWSIRNGESEIGFTLHRMDAELDTGPILAQASIELGDEHSWEELEPKLVTVVGELLPRVDLDQTIIAVTADHATPCALKGHAADPVPLVVSGGGVAADATKTFGEREAERGDLGLLVGVDIMPLLVRLAST